MCFVPCCASIELEATLVEVRGQTGEEETMGGRRKVVEKLIGNERDSHKCTIDSPPLSFLSKRQAALLRSSAHTADDTLMIYCFSRKEGKKRLLKKRKGGKKLTLTKKVLGFFFLIIFF